MNPIASPKSYSEMLTKIAIFNFIGGVILFFIITQFTNVFEPFLNFSSVKMKTFLSVTAGL